MLAPFTWLGTVAVADISCSIRVADPHIIEIGRTLHDQMELTRHVPSAWER